MPTYLDSQQAHMEVPADAETPEGPHRGLPGRIDPLGTVCRMANKATSWKEEPPMGNFLLGVLMSTVGSLVADILKRVFRRG
jgi:hypothetical protein